jgi:galactose oxidase
MQYAVRETERFTPGGSPQWSLMAPATIARDYHSTALLLPDGSVWTGGSNIRGQADNVSPSSGVPWLGPRAELRTERFQPPYMFSTRPFINDVWHYHSSTNWQQVTGAMPIQARRDGWFWVNVANADPSYPMLGKMVLVRNGTFTHAFNSDQRLIELDQFSIQGTTATAHIPVSSSVVIPGPYMLFCLWWRDNMWVPGVARMVLIQ